MASASPASSPRPLALGEFVLDPATGVLVSPLAPAQTTSYADGAEQFLLDAIRESSDRGTHSRELRDHVHDWGSLYHLSPYRSTILDCLGLAQRRTRVLELGAGCGAVTRWLGEHFDDVHAVEGSRMRAAVAHARCADLGTVGVYSSNFFDLDARHGFDLATLIGVLEYSHVYHPELRKDPAGAALATLRMAHGSLREDGLLVVAIENKLGLKYWSGAREDHSGGRFDGIHGYPSTEHAVTWSARELERLLLRAGFEAVDFYLPFPDYKLARSIVNPAAAADDHYLHNWIETPFPDRVEPARTPLFNEALALRELASAGLLRDLANSFLVLAYKGDRSRVRADRRVEDDWVARHYSLDRHPCFAKRTTLAPGPGGPVVANEPVAPAAPAVEGLEQTVAPEPFRPGDLAVFSLFEHMAAGRLEAALPGFVARIGELLLDRYGAGCVDGDGVALLSGDALDVVPWNLVADPATGEWAVIDREWRFPGLLPVDFVLWRGLVHFAVRYRDLPGAEPAASADAFALRWTSVAVPEAAGRAALLAQLEQWVQYAAGATGDGEARRLEALWGGREPPVVRRLRAQAEAPSAPSVLAFADELLEQPDLLLAYRETFGTAASLVVYAPDADSEALAPALGDVLAGTGLGGEEHDVVLLAVPGGTATESRLAASTSAVLTRRSLAGAFAGLERVPRSA